MQYFVWGLDGPDSKAQRIAIMERHWEFIARYDDRLIARGPVLNSEVPQKVMGCIHIVELDDADAAHSFAYDEPFAVEGVFAEIVMMPFRLEVGRTQFVFEGTPDHPRFFVHCPAAPGVDAVPDDIASAHEAYCRTFDPHFLCRGSLLTAEGVWAGAYLLYRNGGPCRPGWLPCGRSLYHRRAVRCAPDSSLDHGRRRQYQGRRIDEIVQSRAPHSQRTEPAFFR